MTNLFRGCDVDSIFGSMGVVDPVCEKAYEPLEWEITADTGREFGARLESRDFDMLLEKRRSHFCDWAFGVLARELSLPSGGTTTSSAMITLPPALPRLLFTMFAAFSDWERPKRSIGRAEKRSEWLNAKEKWSVNGGEVYVAVAVALIAGTGGNVLESREVASCWLWSEGEERLFSSVAREKPRTETPMPAPDAQS